MALLELQYKSCNGCLLIFIFSLFTSYMFCVLRYHKLLAGASWMAEYGDPEKPEEWDFIQHFSPYHMLDSNLADKEKSKIPYPPVLFSTSTKDDRVCPSHARKMVHKMNELGVGDRVYYYVSDFIACQQCHVRSIVLCHSFLFGGVAIHHT